VFVGRGSSRSAPAVACTGDEPTIITRKPSGSEGSVPRLDPSYELGKRLAGERLDHFELIEYVGGGGMGAVFRARDTMLDREVALKVLSRDKGADDETRRRFKNEAQSAARLDHENIARVYYVGEDKGMNYIVFEFIEGVNVRDLVIQRRAPLPLGEALSYTLQVTRALEHASSRDVVHRDIKPSNILITSEGRAKLVDMGLARLHQLNAPGDDLTASGVTLGTFDYISPEQARDPRSADVRSDIYSLGCTLYFMLTGQPPFPEGTVLQKLLQHNSDEPPDPRELNPRLPPEASQLLRKMLAKNPSRRYQSPVELIGDLLVLGEQAGLEPAGVSGLAWGSEGPELSFLERHLPWIVPVCLLLIAVVVLDILSRPPADATSVSTRSTNTGSAIAEPPAASSALPGNGAADPKVKLADNGNLPGDPTSAGISPTAPADPSPPAEAGQAGAETSKNAQPATPLRAGLLVVGDGNVGAQRFASLRAACNAAKTGDVIELRYDGRREERPIALNNVRFTIRAGDGFQPTVVFQPDDIDPLRYPRSMLTISGGRLTLLGLALELELPEPEKIPADGWSLFTLHRPESLELERCSLTIRRRAEQVAFFDMQPATGTNSMMANEEQLIDEPAIIHLEDCIVRGEAIVLRTSDLEPVHFTWENGLAVTTECFLSVGGGQLAPRHMQHVRLTLRHLTTVVGSGFCRLSNSFDAPFLSDVSIDCGDSILLSLRSGPLVEQQGVDGVGAFERQLTWHGDRNFYQGFDADAFWRIIDLDDAEGSQRRTFPEWVAHWGPQQEFLPTWGEIAWKHRPTIDRPVDTHAPADYALADAAAGNMARAGASDGHDVGASAGLLPALPSEPAKADASPAANTP